MSTDEPDRLRQLLIETEGERDSFAELLKLALGLLHAQWRQHERLSRRTNR